MHSSTLPKMYFLRNLEKLRKLLDDFMEYDIGMVNLITRRVSVESDNFHDDFMVKLIEKIARGVKLKSLQILW